MGDQIDYQGRNLASLHVARRGKSGMETALAFNNPQDAATFMKLGDREVISFSGSERQMGDFRNSPWYQKITAIYTSPEDYLESSLMVPHSDRA